MYPTKVRLATNSHLTLLRCEREFQLIELLQGNEFIQEQDNPTLIFGRAWGEGITEYIATGSLDAAVYHAWRFYYPIMEETDRGWQEEFCYNGLKAAKQKLDSIREDWEIADFNGRPAREVGFRVNIGTRFYYESSMDAVLRHKQQGHLALLENKHTMTWVDDVTPMYKNAAQGISYSIVLDEMAKQALGIYHLHYLVAQFTKAEGLHKPRIQHFKWKKTLLERLNWFVSLGLDVDRLEKMMDMNIFPMRGNSCRRYNRTCPFFGSCHLRSTDVPKTDEYVQKHKNAHVKEVEASVQFVFDLDTIVQQHLQKAKEEIDAQKHTV